MQVTGGISTQENIHVGGDATLTGTFSIGTTAGSQLVLAETASGSGSYKLENTNTDGDIVFTVDDNNVATPVMSLVGADASLRMTSVRPLEFNASANSITGTDAVTLTVTSPTLKLNGTTKTSVVGELELLDSLIFANAGSEANRFTIAEDGVTGNYVINNEVNNKDVIFKANLGGTATEVMRVDGSAGSLLMEGEQQLQFAVAANYISSTSGSTVNRGLNIVTAGNGDLNTTTGGDFNLTATGELDITANTVSVTAPAITKTLTSETMT